MELDRLATALGMSQMQLSALMQQQNAADEDSGSLVGGILGGLAGYVIPGAEDWDVWDEL